MTNERNEGRLIELGIAQELTDEASVCDGRAGTFTDLQDEAMRTSIFKRYAERGVKYVTLSECLDAINKAFFAQDSFFLCATLEELADFDDEVA